MAGHSKFKNIQFRKSAQDKKRAGMFGKIAREITAAARSNPDPSANPRLRSAIANARGCNMPNDNIERAIKRSRDEGVASYESIRYEGFAPGGVGVIVEALTNNRNRTAGELRAIFGKLGGSMGERGSVSFLFEQIGSIVYSLKDAKGDEMLEAAIDAGASDYALEEGSCEFFCDPDTLHDVSGTLESHFGSAESTRLAWRANTSVAVSEEDAGPLLKLLDALEDNDDVQQVYSNFEMSDEVMERVSANG